MEVLDISTFDSTKLKINIPSQSEDGQFSKLVYNNSPIIIQTPISLTKQGVIKHGKKLVCDLMFKSIETEFLNWFEQLETSVHTMLFNKGSEWFEQKLELVDIENLFSTPVKIFKSGKYYLLRANLKETIKVFKENNNIFDLTYSDITSESNIISILEIKGVKYTNKDFQFDIEIKQMMIVQPDPFSQNCFIKLKRTEKEEEEKETIPDLGSKIMKIDIDNIVNELIEKKDIEIDLNISDPIEIPAINISEPQLEELKVEDLGNLNDLEMLDFNIDAPPIKEYPEEYQTAKKEAKDAKERAISTYLKLEEIKKKYKIEDESDENVDL